MLLSNNVSNTKVYLLDNSNARLGGPLVEAVCLSFCLSFGSDGSRLLWLVSGKSKIGSKSISRRTV